MRTIIKKAFLTGVLASLLLALPSLTAAQSRSKIDVAALGPQINDVVPGFSLWDQNGQMQTLESIAGNNGTMLLFHRSADW